jgi:hypothetical protein
MKKLLILAYDFPPYVSVGAVLSLSKYGLRPYNWYRYLKAYDVEPIVITRQRSNAHGNHLDLITLRSFQNRGFKTPNKALIFSAAEMLMLIRSTEQFSGTIRHSLEKVFCETIFTSSKPFARYTISVSRKVSPVPYGKSAVKRINWFFINTYLIVVKDKWNF